MRVGRRIRRTQGTYIACSDSNFLAKSQLDDSKVDTFATRRIECVALLVCYLVSCG